MDIPALQGNGELPPGEHPATVDDVEAVFGSSTGRRRLLMRGLRAALANFELSGVRTLWLNGSFTTDKNEPNDIDGCWEYTPDVDIKRLDPVFCYVTNWEESRIQNIVPLPRPERAKLDVPGRYPLRLTSCPAASGFRPGQVCAMAPMLMVLYHRNSRIAFAHANSISYMLSGCAVR